MANKITYNDKAPFQNNPDIPDDNKVLAKNMNEIKTVVNTNADELDTAKENIENLQGGQGTSNAEITSLKNRVSTLETDNETNKTNITNLQSNKVDKVEGKGLSTEDFTTELKSKLEGLKNYDDTEIKEDISNLEAGQTEQDKQIDMLINALPTETQENEYINLKGTIPTKFKEFKLSGNSKQETRSGKNMLAVINASVTSNGVTVTNNGDGSITLNGTATANVYYNLNANRNSKKYFTLINGNTYGILLKNSVNGLSFIARSETKNYALLSLTSGEERTMAYNYETDGQCFAYIQVNSGTVLNNVTVYPMLVEGAEIGEWEQYGAMPSPEFISKTENVESKNILINKMENQTAVGVEVRINKDKSITLNGTATGNTWINVTNNLKLRAGDYTLSLKNKISGLGLYLGSDVNTDYAVTQSTTSGEKTFNLQEETTFDVARIRIMSGTVFNNLTVYPMLEEGTVATEYKTNGINVTVGNKNWVEVDNINKEYITMNGNGTFTINGTLQQNDSFRFISSLFLPAGKYRMSLGIDYNKFNNSYYNIAANGEQLKYYNSADVSFELEEAASINATTILVAGTYSNLIVKPMIERTDRESSSDWIEHQEQIVNFPLAQGQKLMLGDYLAADGIHHKRKQIELDGTENIIVNQATYNVFKINNINDIGNNGSTTTLNDYLCTHFKEYTQVQLRQGNIGFAALGGEVNAIYLGFGANSEVNSVEACKSFLAQQKAAGTPVILEYELAEEETEAYTEEQQEAYNQLINLKAYEEETNVYSTNSTSPIFKVTAVKDINSVITQLNTVLLERS